MNLPLYLSRKIYGAGDVKKKVSQPAIKIATLGVAVGIAVMLVSVSVVFGFKHTIRDKVVGFGGHIEVANFMTQQTSESYPIIINDSMLNVLNGIQGIRHSERFSVTQGILKTDKDFLGVALKGVAEEWDSAFIHKNMKEGFIPKFSSKSNSNNILISKSIANKLNLKCGERIFAYFINEDGVRTRRFKICGIYETNLSQFDDVTCFVDLYTSVKLNGWEEDQALGAELKVADFSMLDFIEDNVVNKVNRTIDRYGSTYSSKTIKELNPQIFGWLDLLDLNVWIILALMTLVASVTMVSGLLIIILERTRMIGTMKALGARNGIIRRTFLWLGIFIISKGLLLGNVLGIGIIIIQKYFGIVKLDAHTYYVNTVPVEINIPLFVLINFGTLIISILVLVIPSYLISHINPSKTIRFE
jgi:lipoprotein-releasing system permease protein